MNKVSYKGMQVDILATELETEIWIDDLDVHLHVGSLSFAGAVALAEVIVDELLEETEECLDAVGA